MHLVSTSAALFFQQKMQGLFCHVLNQHVFHTFVFLHEKKIYDMLSVNKNVNISLVFFVCAAH